MVPWCQADAATAGGARADEETKRVKTCVWIEVLTIPRLRGATRRCWYKKTLTFYITELEPYVQP